MDAASGTTAVIVVHGVGDPQPGEALGDLVASLGSVPEEPLVLTGPVLTHRLQDHSRLDRGRLSFFPVQLAEGVMAGRKLVFAEVFWGEASRVPAGLLGVLRGLFSLIFGLEAVISGNRSRGLPKGPEGPVMVLARAGSECLRGPVFAINLLLLVGAGLVFLLLLAGAGGGAWDLEALPVGLAWPVILISSAVVGGVGLWLFLRIVTDWRSAQFRGRADYLPLAAASLLFAVYWPVAAAAQGADTWRDWARILFDPLLLAFDITSLVLFLVLVLYLLTWLPLFGRASHRSMSARAMALAIQYGIWGLVVPALWLSVVSLVGSADWLGYYRHAVPADGAQWLLLPLPLLALGGVYLARRVRTRRSRKTPENARIPRLLISGWIRTALVLGSFHVILAGYALRFVEPANPVREFLIPADLIGWIRAVEIRAIPAALLLLATTFLLGGVRLALDVANDVTNYLNLNIRRQRKRAAKGSDRRELLRPIRGRFNEVIRHVRSRYEPDRYVVLAHSLGSMIAVDELAESRFGEDTEWLEETPLGLITLGSPLAHLFQHYFPVAYPPWNDPWWDDLAARVDRWLNLYRIDDFVGTSLEMGGEAAERFGFEEHGIGAGGHLHYWKDPRVVGRIAREILA